MSNQQTDWVEILRNTLRYREAIQETAATFTARSADAYERLGRHLIDKGEDKALGILLRVSTMNGIKLDPNLLAETIKVVDVLDDFSVPYALHNETAIDPLLSVAQAEDISSERQAFAGILAAELAVRFDSDRQAVKRVLLKLSNKAGHPLDRYLIDRGLDLLEAPLPTGKEMRFETQRDPLDRIPEEEPRVVTGGTYTVRRTVPKTGRNEPCHCGSGKKYKKCCLEKDRELMRDASPYEGVTMTQARTAPDLVDDAGIIEDMRAYELKKLDPSKLTLKQLYAAFHRTKLFGLRELAFEMLLELESRTGENEFDIGHFEDLLQAVLDAGDTALAEKIMGHVPREALHEPEMVELNYHLIKNRDQFIALENQCRKALIGSDDLIWEDPILNLGHSLEHTFPALSIVFSRATIVGNPDRIFDNEVLLDVIRSARAEIGLDPWSDPSEDYFEWTLDKLDSDLEEESKSKEVEELAIKVKEAGERASGKEKELRQREKELQDLAKSLEKEKQAVAAATQVSDREAPVSDEERQTVARLRQRIEDLKGEVQSQQHIRRELQQQLRKERRKAIERQEQQPLEEKSVSEQALSIKPEKTPKKILIPEFTSEFQRSCESMPVSVVAKALRASTAFAAHDETVWRKTTTIKRLTHIYRIRLTIDHRLMIRWQPDERLQILEIIPRSQLETWVRQHAR